jgi:hypothetical protein
MASPAQILANQANAQHSTGPRTEEGKAKSAQNHRTHGLSLGIFTLSPEIAPEFRDFEAKLAVELSPQGAAEWDVFRQFLDGSARILQIRHLVANMIKAHDEDPLLVPELTADVRQLTRYRAAAEMVAFRALRLLRELQTARLFRMFHLTPEERKVVPPVAQPGRQFELNGDMLAHNDREIFYHVHGAHHFTGRFNPPPDEAPTTFTGSNPMARDADRAKRAEHQPAATGASPDSRCGKECAPSRG